MPHSDGSPRGASRPAGSVTAGPSRASTMTRRFGTPFGVPRGCCLATVGPCEVLVGEPYVHCSKFDQPMSALGQKQTSRRLQPMSALPPKADIGTQSRNVRYVPKADMRDPAKTAY